MFDMPTILVARLPSEKISPFPSRLLWTELEQLVFLRHSNFAVCLDRWDFKGEILLMHPEKVPSEVSQLHQMLSNHLDPFVFTEEAESQWQENIYLIGVSGSSEIF